MTKRSGFLAGLSLVAVLVAGCGGDTTSGADDPASSEPTTGESTGAPIEEDLKSDVELLDAGAEPRQAIRLTPEAGSVQHSTMVMNMSTSARAPGQEPFVLEVGPITMEVTNEIVDVADNGDITFSQTFDDVTVDGPAEVVAQMQPIYDNLIGFEFGGTINAVGFLVEGDLDLPSVGDPTLDQTLGEVTEQMAGSFAAVPVEPIGVGASWRVPMELEAGGLTISSDSHFELVEIDGSELTLEVSQTQSADPTEMAAGVRVESVDGEASGQTQVRTDQLLPASSETEMTQRMVMTIEQGGQTREVEQRMRMTMTLTSK